MTLDQKPLDGEVGQVAPGDGRPRRQTVSKHGLLRVIELSTSSMTRKTPVIELVDSSMTRNKLCLVPICQPGPPAQGAS